MIRTRRNRSLQFDSLEKREFPSAIAGSMIATGPATVQHNINFHFVADLSARITDIQRQRGVIFTSMPTVVGKSFNTGVFGGQFMVTSHGEVGAELQGELETLSSSTLDFTMPFPRSGDPRLRSSRPFQEPFTVTGGTDLFENAVGGGTATITPTQTGLSFTFMLDGLFLLS